MNYGVTHHRPVNMWCQLWVSSCPSVTCPWRSGKQTALAALGEVLYLFRTMPVSLEWWKGGLVKNKKAIREPRSCPSLPFFPLQLRSRYYGPIFYPKPPPEKGDAATCSESTSSDGVGWIDVHPVGAMFLRVRPIFGLMLSDQTHGTDDIAPQSWLAWTCDSIDFFSVSLSVTNLGKQFNRNAKDIVRSRSLLFLIS